jgi:hypothetical protein
VQAWLQQPSDGASDAESADQPQLFLNHEQKAEQGAFSTASGMSRKACASGRFFQAARSDKVALGAGDLEGDFAPVMPGQQSLHCLGLY